MNDKDIAALLEALCERPLTDGPADPRLGAFRKAALQTLSEPNVQASQHVPADPDVLNHAIAALLSGREDPDLLRGLEDAMARSPAVRLDVQSALAFVSAIDASPQSAPGAIVEQMLAGHEASLSRLDRHGSRVGARLAGIAWPTRRWRVAAAAVMLLAAGAGSWSIYGRYVHPLTEQAPAPPAARSYVQPAEPGSGSIADTLLSPAAPARQECEHRQTEEKETENEKETSRTASNARPSPVVGCPPAADEPLAIHPFKGSAKTPAAAAGRSQHGRPADPVAAGADQSAKPAVASPYGPLEGGRAPPPAASTIAPGPPPGTR